MGASGASRGCPRKDSEGGESSFGGSFSAFAVGGDCTPRLAVKIDIVVTCASCEREETSRPVWSVGTTRTRVDDEKG
jgi:hypothetical protein